MRRPAPPREIPPPLELECLKVLWTQREASVQEVKQALQEGDRILAYTTVLTVLDRLVRRGAVQRRKQGRAFYYAPVLDLDRARRSAVKELLDTYFFGSAEELRSYLDSSDSSASAATGISHSEPALDPTLL